MKIQEETLQEQWQEEQERELLYAEMSIQNYDFDYGREYLSYLLGRPWGEVEE